MMSYGSVWRPTSVMICFRECSSLKDFKLEEVQRRINQTLQQDYGIPADATSQKAEKMLVAWFVTSERCYKVKGEVE